MKNISSFIPKEPPNSSDWDWWCNRAISVINKIFAEFGIPKVHKTKYIKEAASRLSKEYGLPADALKHIAADHAEYGLLSMTRMNDGSVFVYCIDLFCTRTVYCNMNRFDLYATNNPCDATVALIGMRKIDMQSVETDRSWIPLAELFIKIAKESSEFTRSIRIAMIPKAIDMIASSDEKLNLSSQMIANDPIMYTDYNNRHCSSQTLKALVKEYARELLK